MTYAFECVTCVEQASLPFVMYTSVNMQFASMVPMSAVKCSGELCPMKQTRDLSGTPSDVRVFANLSDLS